MKRKESDQPSLVGSTFVEERSLLLLLLKPREEVSRG